MKKTLLLIIALCASISTYAQTSIENMSLDVTGTYTDEVIINGVNRIQDVYGLGLNVTSPATNNIVPVDVTVGGLFMPTGNGQPEGSIWNAGIGKTFTINDDYALRLEGGITSINTEVPNIPDTVEGSVTAALINPLVTPYVSYVHDWNIQQNGFAIGLRKDIAIDMNGVHWFDLTPSVSYYIFDDYDAFLAKARLSLVRWNRFTPFFEARFNDADFDNGVNVNWATHEANSETSYLAGVSFNF